MIKGIHCHPDNYKPHLIHGESRIWQETNCYTDLWVELLNGLEFEPIAALPFTLAIDFEGDQWTFFKFPIADLTELFGLDIQELTIWNSLIHHIDEQVKRDRPVVVELDSFFLPDTHGTAYKVAHVKSSVAVVDMDIEAKKMLYFHNKGFYALEGQDFEDIFLLNGLESDRILPPYVEYVKINEQHQLSSDERRDVTLKLIKRHLGFAPVENPFPKFKERLENEIAFIQDQDIGFFHEYSFANIRQFGASFELSATLCKWLTDQGVDGLTGPEAQFLEIANKAKAFQFQLARSVNRKKPLDLTSLDSIAVNWQAAMDELRKQFC